MNKWIKTLHESFIRPSTLLWQVCCAWAPPQPRRSPCVSTWRWRPAAAWSPAAASVTHSAPGKANVSHSPLRWETWQHRMFLLIKTSFKLNEAERRGRKILHCYFILYEAKIPQIDDMRWGKNIWMETEASRCLQQLIYSTSFRHVSCCSLYTSLHTLATQQVQLQNTQRFPHYYKPTVSLQQQHPVQWCKCTAEAGFHLAENKRTKAWTVQDSTAQWHKLQQCNVIKNYFILFSLWGFTISFLFCC